MQQRLAVLFFLCAACVDPKLAAVPGDGGEFARALYTKFGERVTECTGQPEAAVARGLRIDDLEKRIANSVNKKRLAYDRATGKECLDALATAECAGILDLFVEGEGACDRAYTGLVEIDGNCYEANECAPGSFCELVGECLGVCAKYTRLGGACGAGTVCEPNTQCIGQLCRERADEGEACAGVTGIGCKTGLFCKQTSPSAGVCSRRAEEGSCFSSNECALGYQCGVVDPAVEEGACIVTRREGEACDPGMLQCAAFTSCGDGNVCTVWGSEGAPCGILNNEVALCIDSWCGLNEETMSDTVGICKAPFSNDEACDVDEQCKSGICDGVCVAACPLQ